MFKTVRLIIALIACSCSPVHSPAVADNGPPEWRLQYPHPGVDEGNAIRYLNSQTIIAVGRSGSILRSTDAGTSWRNISSPTKHELVSVAVAENGSCWAAGEKGTLLKSTDMGITWTAKQSGTALSLHGLSFADNRTGWAVGDSGIILTTSDAGETWAAQASGVSFKLSAVQFHDPLVGWAIGAAPSILRTLDGGKNWSTVAIEKLPGLQWPEIIYSLCFINRKTGWVVGHAATAYKTNDGGLNWEAYPTDINVPAQIHFIDSLTGWLTGYPGLQLTRDGGETWMTLRDVGIRFLEFFDGKRGCGIGGSIWCSSDSGFDWTSRATGNRNELLGIQFVDKRTGWARPRSQGSANLSSYLLKTVDGGSHWVEQYTGNWFSDLNFVNQNEGWGVNGGCGIISMHVTACRNTISSTSDGGMTWKPLFDTSSSESDAYWQINSVDFLDSRIGCVVGGRSGKGWLLKTTDGGSSWVAKVGFVDQHLIAVRMLDADTVFAMGDANALFKTMDGGDTWTQLTTPGGLTLNNFQFIDGNTGWAWGFTLQDGDHMIKTIDGGSSWSFVEIPGFHILSLHFIDSDNGWAGGSLGEVLETHDGGESWKQSYCGIPRDLNAIFFVDTATGWAAGRDGAIMKFGK